MTTEMRAEISPEFLAGLTAGLSQTTEPVPDGSVPQGSYSARLVAVVPGVSKSGGNYMNLDLEILGPNADFVGAPLTAHYNLITPVNFAIFKKTLRRLGVFSDDAAAILEELQALEGSVWNITVKHREGYTNIYFNRAIREN